MEKRHGDKGMALGLVALLAACTGGGDSGEAASPRSLHFTDCEEQTALLVVAPAQLPPLPEGFAYGNLHQSGLRRSDGHSVHRPS